MHNLKIAARCIALTGLFGLTGCFSLGRNEPQQRHYVLGGDRPQNVVASNGEAAGLSIGVRRLRLASYLEAPFLVVRPEPQQVSYSEYHRWAEPLGGGINRVVAGNLASDARFRAVDVAPWPAREQYDYLVQLNVERFEGVMLDRAALEGEVQVLVNWEILQQRDGTVLARGTTDFRRPGWEAGDLPAMVRLLDAGLDALSLDLANSLSRLGAPLAERR
jgi:uncharacterized protein